MPDERPEQPRVNRDYLLEKFPGKGGWTFARIPEIPQDRKAWFGWVKVRGSIDGVPIQKYHLMPMGDGYLFLPVKAEIRKKIGKQAGDWVRVILYPDNEPLQTPEEMLLCLKDEPVAWQFYQSLSEAEQKRCIDWVYSAKAEATRVERLAEVVNRLARKEKV